LNFFGLPFTALHVTTGVVFYYCLSLLMEKVLLKKEKGQIYEALSQM
jgi:hypothetical protein